MSIENIGNKLRQLRERNQLPLREVAALLDVDIAILSKMERGERRFNKVLVQKLAKYYNHDIEELMVLYLSDLVVCEIGDEDLALQALEIAEKQIKFQKSKPLK